MTADANELSSIRKELETISIAVAILAIDKTGAGDADERKRHDSTTLKGLEVLLKRIEEI